MLAPTNISFFEMPCVIKCFSPWYHIFVKMILGIMGVLLIKSSKFLHLVTPLPTCITKIKFTSTPPCVSPYSDNDLVCYPTQNTLFMHVVQVHLMLKSYVPPCSFSSCNVLFIFMSFTLWFYSCFVVVIQLVHLLRVVAVHYLSYCYLFCLVHVNGIITYIFFATHNPQPYS